MAYRDFKDLPRRTVSDKIFCDKVFDIAKKSKLWWKSKGSCFSGLQIFWENIANCSTVTQAWSETSAIENKIMLNQELAEELHKPTIRKFKSEMYIRLLKRILGVLTLRMCNW